MQPVGHRGHQPGSHQSAPGTRAGARQGQPLLAAEPGEAGNELVLAAFADLPATVGMMLAGRWCDHRLALGGAVHHLLQAWDGQPGKADGHLVTGADVELAPTCQRSQAHLGDSPVIQGNRQYMQDWRNPAGTADAEAYFAHFGQGLRVRVLPRRDPVGRLGLPALGRRPDALAQHNAIGGEGQG